MTGNPIVRTGGGTDTGRMRTVNQDNWFVADHVYVVADGMGGHAAGEVASAIATARLAELADHSPLRPDDVRAALIDAHAAITASAAEHAAEAGMGTTVTGLCQVRVAGSPHWLVFNVGDSRVYRFADGALTQLTEDHSHVAELVAAGEMTQEEAREHPLSSIVTRSLGSPDASEPDFWVFPPVPRERFLICSDGLTGELTDDLLALVLAEESAPQAAVDRLIAMALAAGGRDNVTVVVVDHLAVACEPLSTTAPRGGR
jgi:protein phosphatase